MATKERELQQLRRENERLKKQIARLKAKNGKRRLETGKRIVKLGGLWNGTREITEEDILTARKAMWGKVGELEP